MQENKLLYTILSVSALIIVIIGIAFALMEWNNKNNNIDENNTLIS